jgi:branched-chain amino acid transport system permease protein
MEQFLTFGIVGLSTAAIYAVIGSGLVLTYVTTGVFNFAHGAAGMLAAFCYWQFTVGWGWPVPVALAVVLLVLAPAFGLAVERVLMRPVQRLGEAERLVMTVALLSGAIAAARWIWAPDVPRPLSVFFADNKPFHIGPATVTWHQALTMTVAVAVAAVFGRLRSLPYTFAGAVVVGCLESYLTGYLPQNQYLPGLRLAAPALLLFLALLLFRHPGLRHRDRRLVPVPAPSMRGTAVFAASTIAFGAVLATVLDEADLVSYGPIFSLGIVALSYVPLAGYAGQISLCQLSMAGIGAVVWGHLGAHGELWALAAAIAVSGAAGALIAVPALRFSGVYLALGTAAFAVVLDRWIFTLPAFHLFGMRIALFDQGSVEMSGPDLFGLHLDSAAELTMLAAVFLGLASLAVARLRRGGFGRRLIALRDSEAAYATLGGNLLVTKVAVFALSAGIAGLGGALYGMQQRTITAEQFNLIAGLPIFLVAVVGGLGAVGNGLFAGTAFLGPNVLLGVASWTQNIVTVLPALAGMGLGHNPEGIVARFRRDWEPLGRDRIALPALLGVLALGWVLRLTDVINGWTLLIGSLVAASTLRAWATARRAPKAAPDIPVEWWGVRRPWRPQDGEVLARATAGS